MKITINLATKPFVELRPLFARLRIAMAALAVVGVALGFGMHTLSARAADARDAMDALKNRTAQFQNEKLTDETRMREPQNAAVLQRSAFLNDLFAKKSFSWTAVMMDLEDVLPAGVQVTSIEPSIGQDRAVNIRLKVSGDRDRAVELVRNLETSRRFLNPRLSDESVQAQSQTAQRGTEGPPGAVEFDILAGYNPLPLNKEEADKTKKTATAAKSAAAPVVAKRPAAAKPAAPAMRGGAR